jgi:ankyrin repeat protein
MLNSCILAFGLFCASNSDTISFGKMLSWIESCDTVALSKLSKTQMNFVYAEEDRNSPLHIAADRGSLAVIKYMVRHGAEINVLDDYGSTPLTISIFNDSFPAATFLVENGADPNFISTNHHAQAIPLFTAMKRKSPAMVKLLLEHGADFKIEGSDDLTPLQFAACSGNLEILKLILAKDNDIYKKDDDGNNSLDLAKQCKNKEVEIYLEDLFKKRPVRTK